MRLPRRIRFGADAAPGQPVEGRHLSVSDMHDELPQRECADIGTCGSWQNSFCTAFVRHALWKRYEKAKVWITGSTGGATLDLHGNTIHSQSEMQRGQ